MFCFVFHSYYLFGNILQWCFTSFQHQSGRQLEPKNTALLSESHSGVIYIPALVRLDIQLFTMFSPLIEAVFSADISPDWRVVRLCIPLTDVCEHCSSEIKETKWRPEIQLTEQQPVSQATGCIDFGQRAGASVERSSLIWLDGQFSYAKQLDVLQMRAGWISFTIHGKVHKLSSWV